MAYNKMAFVYDQFMESAPYQQWVAFTQTIIATHLSSARSIIDLGCGTGEIAVQLAQNHYQVTGVDMASDMLSIAHQKAMAHHLSLQWVEQDITALEVPANYDVAVSYCDVINYVTTEEQVNQVFTNVYQTIREGGLFLFDFHSLRHVEQDLVGNTFAEMYDDMGYVWFCDAGEIDGEMYHDLTFFVQDQQQYDRFDEHHHQRTFPTDMYIQWLQHTGFSIVGICADFDTTFITPKQADAAERVFVICKK
ncbi:class I SAM-dependent DNA methyltransferase [Paraliobacillus ryukyuensis]|uniref:class I SAM-dependent DNA methyltransferase n=1 Tax=Paraliobacillus ryukyuensis TaxID=200904 RepID=UPI0009A810B9|nr:class I SAM-dependent methyltransferase [Paraliobacillus ryukyuensis]